MQFSTIYGRVESLANVTSQRALIKDAIQIGLYRATALDLPHLMTDGYVTTVAPYTTGTVTATNDSTTITGASTIFTAAMIGRKIRVGSDTAWYRISAFVSTTEVTLESVYQGTTGSLQTYSIYKDEYKLPADMDTYKVMRQIENNQSLIDLENTAFDLAVPVPNSAGDPAYSILGGSKLDTYTTGTITVTVGSTTITGLSTAWTSVEGLDRGSKLTVGSVVYTVRSIDSATQITVYESPTVAASASTYSISLDNFIIQFHPYPDSIQNIYFKYQRLPFPLISDQDVPDLPDQWHHILVTAGEIWAWQVKDKTESKIKEALFAQQVQEMWRRIGYISSNRTYERLSQDDIYSSRTLRGLRLPANYGYPMQR